MKKIAAILCVGFIAGSLFGALVFQGQASAASKTNSQVLTSVSSSVIKPTASTATEIKDYSYTPVLTYVSSSASATKSSSSSDKLTVSVSARCSDYNSVGNEWSETFQVNGTTIRSGSSVTLKAGDTITVSSRITELDDSGDDIGTASTSKTLTQSDIDSGFTLSLKVNVTEDNGRYKGNTAKWSVTFDFH